MPIQSIAVLCILLWSQAPAPDRRQETPHVIVTPAAVKAAVVPPVSVSLKLDVEPKPGMHVYSPRQKDYIPVSLTLEKNPAFTAKPAVFPEPEQYFFKALDETQLVYSKPFQITVPVSIGADAKGSIVVKGTLEYQACDDSVCYRPVKVPVEWRLSR